MEIYRYPSVWVCIGFGFHSITDSIALPWDCVKILNTDSPYILRWCAIAVDHIAADAAMVMQTGVICGS